MWYQRGTLLSLCRNLKIGYFSQHHVDQLGSEQTPLELIASKFPGTFGKT